jgi:hypothetical protein
VLVPRSSPPAQQRVEARVAAAELVNRVGVAVLGRDQARKHRQAAAADDVVVVAAAEMRAAHLDHPQAPALAAVDGRELLEADHRVAEAVQVEVVLLGGEVVEEERGGVVDEEVAAQRQHLAAVAQGALGQEADLGQAVEDDALGPDALDLRDGEADGLAELEVGGVDEALLLAGVEAELRGHELEDLDAVEAPTVAGGDGGELAAALGEGDVEAALAAACAVEEELQRQGGLARARSPLDQMGAVGRVAAFQDVVEARDAGRDRGRVVEGWEHGVGHGRWGWLSIAGPALGVRRGSPACGKEMRREQRDPAPSEAVIPHPQRGKSASPILTWRGFARIWPWSVGGRRVGCARHHRNP